MLQTRLFIFIRKELLMAKFEDPIKSLAFELPAGWAYDPNGMLPAMIRR